MVICETERTLIRPLSLNDLAALTSILSDADVMKHSLRGVCDREATQEFIQRSLSCYESHGVGPWAIVEKSSSELIGFCGVSPERVGDVEEISLGYRLGRHYWRAGLASEASQAVLAYVFAEKAFESIVVIIEPDHVASLRVAEKAGFRKYQSIDFHGRGARLYRMSCHEWKALHNQSLLKER